MFVWGEGGDSVCVRRGGTCDVGEIEGGTKVRGFEG